MLVDMGELIKWLASPPETLEPEVREWLMKASCDVEEQKFQLRIADESRTRLSLEIRKLYDDIRNGTVRK